MARCTICQTLIQKSEKVQACDRCGQAYHAECWGENGGCATYGCEAAPVIEKPVVMPTPGQGWGDEKRCPRCTRDIASSLLVCRSCGARFPHADPMTESEYDAFVSAEANAKTARHILIGLFLVAMAGVTAPLAGGLAIWYSHTHRDLLTGQDGAYVALSYGTGALGAVYAVLIAALLLGA